MTTIEKTVMINAPLEKVIELMDDNDRFPEWYAGVVDNEAGPEFPAEVGSTSKMTYKAAGITFDATLTTLENERHKRKFKLDGMIAGTTVWNLTPKGESTKVKLTIDYEMPGGGLGAIADRLIVERTNDKNAEESLANLKAEVESQ